jgi:hypothetical protein
VTPSATARLHTIATHAFPSTTETPEHHFAAVANIITPEDGRIRPKHAESHNTCNKAIHLCIKLDTHLPYDYDARLHKPQIYCAVDGISIINRSLCLQFLRGTVY